MAIIGVIVVVAVLAIGGALSARRSSLIRIGHGGKSILHPDPANEHARTNEHGGGTFGERRPHAHGVHDRRAPVGRAAGVRLKRRSSGPDVVCPGWHPGGL